MLEGSHESCKRIHLEMKPSKYFIIGTLSDASKAYEIGETIGQTREQSRTALRHNCMSVSFKVPENFQGTLKLTPSCSVFVRVLPTFEEQLSYLEILRTNPELEDKYEKPDLAEIWGRYDLVLPDFSVELNGTQEIILDDAITTSLRGIYSEFKVGIARKFQKEWIESMETFDSEMENLRDTGDLSFQAKLIVERTRFFNRNDDLVTVRMINTTPEKEQGDSSGSNTERFLFNAHFIVEIGNATLIPFEYSQDYEEIEYTDKEYLRCLNCHADYEGSSIKTRHWGIFNQQKIVPRSSFKSARAEFLQLENDTLDQLHSISAELENTITELEKDDLFTTGDKEFSRYVENIRIVLRRFNSGIEILESNDMALRSFQLVQRTFKNASFFNGWRLFQIVFMVMMIPELVDIKNPHEVADLVHVRTGGGKSETYFGIVVFQLFFDRLRGKKEGVSGFVKFPLRMLSIQQLQRFAKIIAWADRIKREEDIEGEPLSLGYFVGQSQKFPRYDIDLIKEIEKKKAIGENIQGTIFDTCPFCPDNQPVILAVDTVAQRIIHTCTNCGGEFLLYFSQDEVYRFLPSFIVSTVDKLASVGTNRRFRNLLGGNTDRCTASHGVIPSGDTCEVQIKSKQSCKNEGSSTYTTIEGPSLMIQDELHLLREGFGTINSHYESTIDAMLNEFSRKHFKYIGLTATVSGVKNQIEHLYGRSVFVYPGRNPDQGSVNDFFFEKETDSNGMNKIQRVLIGLKPNLRDNQYASLNTIHHLVNYLKFMESNAVELADRYGISLDEYNEILSYYKTWLTYHTKKADVHGMYYYMHAVVQSKLKDIDIVYKPLTGDNSLDEIKHRIKEIQDYNGKDAYVTFATSVVSHGVDIDKWNVMIYQGMTNNASEYIQSFSRVGRKCVGLIFLWFYPNRVRDLSYYQNFELFNNTLDRRVEHVPLSRWTKLGFQQTFTSIFCGAILNYVSNKLNRPIYKVDHVNEVFIDPNNRKLLIDFLKTAYLTTSKHPGSAWIDSQISSEAEERLNYLATYCRAQRDFFPIALADSNIYYYKTQFGMRGIQDEIILTLDYKQERIKEALEHSGD